MRAFHKVTIWMVAGLSAGAAWSAQTPVIELIDQAARAQLGQRAAVSALAEPTFDIAVAGSRPAPACNAPLAVEALDTRQLSRMRFAARCPDGAGWRQEYVVRARMSALVAVMAGPVAANTVLSAADIAFARRDITQIGDPVGRMHDAVGRASRRSLRAGDILRAGNLVAPLAIKRGDAVAMVAREDGIEVSMAGEALDAGARGDVVRVRNGASGLVVRMRVVAPGIVQPVDSTIELPLAE